MRQRPHNDLLADIEACFAPAAEPHICHYRVLYGDTDAGGVVYYANYLRFFELGRTEFMRARVLSYHEVEEQGLILPVVECVCRYRKSARYDDLLRIESVLAEAGRASCRFLHRIFRQEDGALLAFGGTRHAPVDGKGRVRRFPPDLLAALQRAVAR